MQTIFGRFMPDSRGAGLAAILGTVALGAAIAAPAQAQSSDKPVISAKLGSIFDNASFTGVVDTGQGQLCYLLNAGGVGSATSAWIRPAGNERAQPIVNLEAPRDGASGGCIAVGADTARALAANPDAYEVSVATQDFPQGKLHGTLGG